MASAAAAEGRRQPLYLRRNQRNARKPEQLSPRISPRVCHGIANTNRKTEKPKPKPIDVAIVIRILAHPFAARESSAVTAWGVPVLRGKTTKRMPVQQQQQQQHTIESFAQRCVYVIYYKRRHFASFRVHCAWANCPRVRNVLVCASECVCVCVCR